MAELAQDSDAEELIRVLGATTPARAVDFAVLKSRRLVPARVRFGPDLCVERGGRYFLIHELAGDTLPEHVADAAKVLSAGNRVDIIAMARRASDRDPRQVASAVIATCAKAKVGLCLGLTSGVALLLPPRYRRRSVSTRTDQEFGHVPSWVLDRLERCSFSPYLQHSISKFVTKYRAATHGGPPTTVVESRLLYRLVDDIADADPRLFFPTHLLHLLQGYEQAQADTSSRDHFFHTFNNLFTGFIIFAELFQGRKNTARPDRFLSDPGKLSRIMFWESLWSLTCLFHDPGYLAQNPWSTFHLTLGVKHNARESAEIPEAMLRRIDETWEVEYKVARDDLLDLFKRTCGSWSPNSCGADVAKNFDGALRRAYFNGSRMSHSVLSALSLIQLCRNDHTVKAKGYDSTKALIASEIAGLSMLFHDQGCRDKLEAAGLPPVPFEELPYAATLMFTDALQDDRRDVSLGEFPKQGVLDALSIDSQEQTVTATVDLRRTALERWPFMVAEYENATHWINRESETKFFIDYGTKAGTGAPVL